MAKNIHLVTIENLSKDATGRAFNSDRIFSVHGALPKEIVRIRTYKKKSNTYQALLVEILTRSSLRVDPHCPHFNICSGCNLQHMPYGFQLNLKLESLEDSIQKAGIKFDGPISVIKGKEIGYRLKARLGLKWVAKKEKVVIGFRERGAGYITDSSTCPVLHECLHEIVFKFPRLLEQTSLKNMVPQLEVVTDGESVAVILRHLKPLTSDDQRKFLVFSEKFNVDIYLQSGGPKTISSIGNATKMYYEVAGCKLRFTPASFIQVNRDINNYMVDIVLEEMDLNSEDKVVDFFCGLGNFSIPIAKYAKKVLGIEFDSDMINLARENATLNKFNNITFVKSDLYRPDIALTSNLSPNYNKIILDPPRSGASSLISQLNTDAVSLVIYVSCNASTLAQDAKILTNQYGYKIGNVFMLDMFPQTIHFETIMVFKK